MLSPEQQSPPCIDIEEHHTEMIRIHIFISTSLTNMHANCFRLSSLQLISQNLTKCWSNSTRQQEYFLLVVSGAIWCFVIGLELAHTIQGHWTFHGVTLSAGFNLAPLLALTPPPPARSSTANIVLPSACSFEWAADMSLFSGTWAQNVLQS